MVEHIIAKLREYGHVAQAIAEISQFKPDDCPVRRNRAAQEFLGEYVRDKYGGDAQRFANELARKGEEGRLELLTASGRKHLGLRY